MEKLLVGRIEITLNHQLLHRLDEKTRVSVANSYIASLTSQADSWSKSNGAPFDSIFELIDARDGCIQAKLKVFLCVAGVAAATVAAIYEKYPIYRDFLHQIATAAAAEYECKVGQHSIICWAALTTKELTEKIYVTQEGDTIEWVIRKVWHVSGPQEKQYRRAILTLHPECFIAGDQSKLRPGKYLIKPTAAMLRQASSM